MTKPEFTKCLIADTLKKLALKTPIDKITIHDLVVACGINRKTFYYHFNDKQSLISWIFNEDFSKFDNVINHGEQLKGFVQYMYDNKAFYVPALASEVQNNLRVYIFKLAQARCQLELDSLNGSKQLPVHSQTFIANYFANAIIGTIIQWAQDGMKANPAELDLDIASITTDCIKHVIDRYAN